MPLTLSPEYAALLEGVDSELRPGVEAIGVAVGARIAELAPSLARGGQDAGGEPTGVLSTLDLEYEDAPDALSLAACLAAHRGYVVTRGRPQGLSTGALAIARLLVWAQRAALLGTAPSIAWIGPAPRLPDPKEGQIVLRASAAVQLGSGTRRAHAAALIAPAAG
jgi:hypothetical protein